MSGKTFGLFSGSLPAIIIQPDLERKAHGLEVNVNVQTPEAVDTEANNVPKLLGITTSPNPSVFNANVERPGGSLLGSLPEIENRLDVLWKNVLCRPLIHTTS
jgi:hypothetical protein